MMAGMPGGAHDSDVLLQTVEVEHDLLEYGGDVFHWCHS